MSTFILTWDGREAGYTQERYAADVAATAAGEEPETTWSVGRRTHNVAVGDTVYLLRQVSERGIVGSGRLTSHSVHLEPHWDDPRRLVNMVHVVWEHVLDLSNRLTTEELIDKVPGHKWNGARRSGNQLYPPDDQTIAALWQARVAAARLMVAGGTLPNWTRDETVLAYDLYLRDYANPRRYADAAHTAVRDLSALLKRLPLHPHPARNDPRFRNPSGVARKVQNIMWQASGQQYGSQNGSALDRQVIADLADADEVRRIAAAIIEASNEIGDTPVVTEDTEPDGAVEGGVLEYLHRRRERDRSIVTAKKNQMLAAGRPLVCEACGVDVADQYDLAAGAVIECHHLQPLASGVRMTTLADLALVCPTCHRALHSRSRWGSVQDLRRHLHSTSRQGPSLSQRG